VRSDASTSLCDLAIQGVGITYLPDFTIHDALKTATLIPILTEYQLTPLGIHAIYPSRSFLPKKTQLFLDFMQSCFQM
jgi:DNA-binding transcriptional LysR family regulator